ncbi:putative remorin [Medicago truncatula]|uniref:Carboxy-terminal region remorin n=1 Tax=Medicago truncatula TaxID=3880 RepID=H2EST4_MEDTR|nr:remorin isoform X2 [Medicago truncatula]AEX20500.1 symbiotic remorin 1 [Medicago truncatula]KEH21042.1 carboxy-terminal region remorin [Medicago truncatula]RHN43320.1 putative remorin [Medicago truncatula]
MEESKNKQLELVDTLTPLPQSESEPREFSYFLEEKEPGNEGTSSSVVKQERVVSDHATSSVDQTTAAGTDTKDSVDRDAVLARVESQKRLALIKAWEENEKTKVENRAYKMQSAVDLWEDDKKASIEAKFKGIEVKLDRKKSEYVEVMQNKIGEIHKSAEEKKAMIEAQKGEEILKVEETAAKFRTRGYQPRRLLGCFSGLRFFS